MTIEIKKSAKTPIMQTVNVKKSFKKGEGQDMLVFDQLNFALYEKEIVALLGKSGSGKSTLLRIIAGLVKPTAGNIWYKGQPIYGPAKGVAMVFQNFALLPWLTVMQNVELGLEALGVPKAERRSRSLEAIDVIGLDGFESAYPKELSGGMRQRVGVARALVVNPDVLLMDEPFSALDVLTADNLSSDLLDLWQDGKTNLKSILFVTHNIEEAVRLADRIVVFGDSPATIRAELTVDIPHPRSERDLNARQLIDNIYTLMTTPAGAKSYEISGKPRVITIGYRLPKVSISELTGFIETLNEPPHRGHKVDLPELAEELTLDIDDLFPITEILEILRFAQVSKGDIELNNAGHLFADADILERKKIFAAHLMNFVPLARHIRRVLDERPGHRASEDRFLRELEDYLSETAAEEVLQQVIEWARYAEVFAYDYNTGILSLENPE